MVFINACCNRKFVFGHLSFGEKILMKFTSKFPKHKTSVCVSYNKLCESCKKKRSLLCNAYHISRKFYSYKVDVMKYFNKSVPFLEDLVRYSAFDVEIDMRQYYERLYISKSDEGHNYWLDSLRKQSLTVDVKDFLNEYNYWKKLLYLIMVKRLNDEQNDQPSQLFNSVNLTTFTMPRCRRKNFNCARTFDVYDLINTSTTEIRDYDFENSYLQFVALWMSKKISKRTIGSYSEHDSTTPSSHFQHCIVNLIFMLKHKTFFYYSIVYKDNTLYVAAYDQSIYYSEEYVELYDLKTFIAISNKFQYCVFDYNGCYENESIQSVSNESSSSSCDLQWLDLQCDWDTIKYYSANTHYDWIWDMSLYTTSSISNKSDDDDEWY